MKVFRSLAFLLDCHQPFGAANSATEQTPSLVFAPVSIVSVHPLPETKEAWQIPWRKYNLRFKARVVLEI